MQLKLLRKLIQKDKNLMQQSSKRYLVLSFLATRDDSRSCNPNPDSPNSKMYPPNSGDLKVASESGVDARIIVTVMLQNSTCVFSAATTYNTVDNLGIMQCHNGVSYMDKASILQMVRDGTEGIQYKGVDDRDGLQQLIASNDIYGGLRASNPGDLRLKTYNLSSISVGTPSYVSDVAKGLTGAKLAHYCSNMTWPRCKVVGSIYRLYRKLS